MKKHIYNLRLLKFARHLQKIEQHERHNEAEPFYFCDLGGNYNARYTVIVPAWLCEELHKLFPQDWERGETSQEYRLKGLDEGLIDEAGIFDYFDLTDKEFTKVFAIKKDADNFPTEIARKIHEFVATRLSQQS